MTYSVTMCGVTTPQWPVESPGEQPFTLQQMAPRKRPRWLLWLVAGLVALGLVGTGVAFYTAGRSDIPRDSGQASEAVLVDLCRDATKAKLKSPSTARFPGGERVEQTGKVWRVFGQVDAQNSFGATLRIDYRCVANRDGDGWSVYSIDVTG